MTDGHATPTETSSGFRALADTPLNHDADQVPELRPRIRQIDLALARETALEAAEAPTTAIFLGFALFALVKKRYLLASLFGAGILLQQALTGPLRGRGRSGDEERRRKRKRLEVERYAMKAQRGDYGKLEVIPFK